MSVRITEIDEDAVGRTMPAGPALDVPAEPKRACDIAGAEHALKIVHDIGEVMETRPCPGCENQIVRVGLSVGHRSQDLSGLLCRSANFDTLKPRLHVVRNGSAHIRNDDLVVIHPQCPASSLLLRLQEHARHCRHARAQFDGNSCVIPHHQRAALVRSLDPFGGQPHSSYVRFAVQVRIRPHTHADAIAARRLIVAPQHKAVVTNLLDATKIDRVAILVADDKARDLDIEVARGGEVLDGQADMAAA